MWNKTCFSKLVHLRPYMFSHTSHVRSSKWRGIGIIVNDPWVYLYTYTISLHTYTHTCTIYTYIYAHHTIIHHMYEAPSGQAYGALWWILGIIVNDPRESIYIYIMYSHMHSHTSTVNPNCNNDPIKSNKTNNVFAPPDFLKTAEWKQFVPWSFWFLVLAESKNLEIFFVTPT